MVDRLRVTELDFDTIKNNLKLFLSQQSEFTDYDFEGSGLSTLLDILAYNTHYNAYYLNMVANEAFLDTALLRDSVVSHAKTLGYTPHSQRASVATINFTVQSSNSDQGTLTIPSGYSFLSNQIDNRTYNFIVLEDTVVTKSNTQYIFENLQIAEGQLITYNFVQEQATNPKQIFTLPDPNIDTNTIRVLVRQSLSNTNFEVYNRVDDVNDVTGEDSVYFLQETRGERYQIYFGNDSIGKAIPDNSVVSVSYLVTNETQANKANNFIATAPLVDSNSESINDFIIEPIVAAAGGADRESVDSIKFSAISQFATQNRLVTFKDYETFILSKFPNLDSISVWGGQENDPPVYGKVFISLKPKENFFLSQTEKQKIINDTIAPKSIVSVSAEIIDPEFLFIILQNQVAYDPKRLSISEEEFKSQIRSTILTFTDTFLNKFESRFVQSKLEQAIDKTNIRAIIGTNVTVKLQKRFTPILNEFRNYEIDFSVPLKRGTVTDKLFSTQFDVFDTLGTRRSVIFEEIPQSFSGISSVEVTNPGLGYTQAPTVTIVGDGIGATAEAIIVNGRIERINVTNRGINYSQATISIIGGNGFGAEASVIIDSKFGNLRTVFFDANAQRQVVNANAAEINYETGKIRINNINILSVASNDGQIRLTIESEEGILQSVRNTILTIDAEDPISIETVLQKS
jgi:predicted amino acid dehydrogenase